MPHKLTRQDFIEKANQVHNNKYNYSQSNYLNNRTKIKIICSDHGEFEQYPNHHLQGQGCPACAGVKKLILSSYIEKVSKIHENKYDYSKVVLKGVKQKIEIICPIHGPFWQRADTHCSHGCPKCSESKGENKIRKWLEFNNINFIPQYTFSECKYKNMLYFDFAVFRDNVLLALIEYDGQFHFFDVFNKNELSDTQKRDKIKNKFCNKNKIKLIRINYLQFDNIDIILEDNFI